MGRFFLEAGVFKKLARLAKIRGHENDLRGIVRDPVELVMETGVQVIIDTGRGKGICVDGRMPHPPIHIHRLENHTHRNRIISKDTYPRLRSEEGGMEEGGSAAAAAEDKEEMETACTMHPEPRGL